MSSTDLTTYLYAGLSDGSKRWIELRMRLDKLITSGKGNSDQAQGLRDDIDYVWYREVPAFEAAVAKDALDAALKGLRDE